MSRTLAIFAAAIGALLSPSPALAEIDWPKVDASIGKKPVVVGTAHRYGLPRSDMRVTVDGVAVKPGFALSGWIAFEPMGEAAMMMGDLVLAESEVKPVMASLLANGVDVTALHNHLLRASPPTIYMHVAAHGDPVKLAKAVREALSETRTPFEPATTPLTEPPKPGFDTGRVDHVMGAKGKNNGGVYQFAIPRTSEIKVEGGKVSSAMGVANAINFQSTEEGKAAITGDFVALEKEVEPLLKALGSNGVEVTALHNHMLDDEPRLFFVHFWANDNALKLAQALRAGLDAVHAARD